MCRLSRLGRSKALPQTSHGSSARSPRCGRAFGDARGKLMVVSCRSPVLLAADEEVDDSPDTDLCSSSVLDGGEMGSMTRESSDMDRSSGDSARTEDLVGRFFFGGENGSLVGCALMVDDRYVSFWACNLCGNCSERHGA